MYKNAIPCANFCSHNRILEFQFRIVVFFGKECLSTVVVTYQLSEYLQHPEIKGMDQKSGPESII